MEETRKRKNPGFPTPPSFRNGDNQQTNDLMSRLQSFLPKMKAANQVLTAESIGRVDIELKKDSDEEDGSDSDECSKASDSSDKIEIIDDNNRAITKENSGENNVTGENSEPMIQIQFALTDPNNPMMELLANANEKKEEGSENDNEDGENDDDGEGPAKVRAVKSMLKSSSSITKQASPKISILEVNQSPKKSLITELS